MLKYVDYDIVFQEIPDEVTLAINLSLCPNRCPGCHSPHLMKDVGDILNEDALRTLHEKYGRNVTCISFQGGDGDPMEVARLALFIRREFGLKTAWYSGREALPTDFPAANLDFIKIGPYKQEFGGLKDETTNQRLYRVTPNGMEDITYRFWEKRFK